MKSSEAIILGNGIAGAWCALKLISSGVKTTIVDGDTGGSTRKAVGAISTDGLLSDFDIKLNTLSLNQANPTIAPIIKKYLSSELSELEIIAPLCPIKIGVKPECNTKELLNIILNSFLEKGGQVIKGTVSRLIVHDNFLNAIQYETEEERDLISANYIVIASGGYANICGKLTLKTNNYGTVHGLFLQAGGWLANMEFIFQHGFGNPDTSSLTPTEELQGAAITNSKGENVTWLEEALFNGEGTKQHQKAVEFWRSNRSENFFVTLGYQKFYKKIIDFNDLISQTNLQDVIKTSYDIALLFPFAEQNQVKQYLFHKINQGEKISYPDYKSLRMKMPCSSRLRISNLPYFSMGGIAHDNCRTNLKNIFVTGEAMHDFGANRTGGLPWMLYLCCASHIKNLILLDKKENVTVKRPPSDFIYFIEQQKEDVSDQILNIMWQHRSQPFSIDITEQAINILRNLRKRIVNKGVLHDGVSLTLVAESILVSSLKRKESRGCFYRDDFPRQKQSFDNKFIFSKYLTNADKIKAFVVNKADYINSFKKIETVDLYSSNSQRNNS
ncbi:MAG: hypothetical protein ACU84J_07125 [Gammaproteobacteria bacterium]